MYLLRIFPTLVSTQPPLQYRIRLCLAHANTPEPETQMAMKIFRRIVHRRWVNKPAHFKAHFIFMWHQMQLLNLQLLIKNIKNNSIASFTAPNKKVNCESTDLRLHIHRNNIIFVFATYNVWKFRNGNWGIFQGILIVR